MLFVAAFLLQVAVETGKPKVDSVSGDTVRMIGVSVGRRSERKATRIPVTPEHLATAFRTPAARTLLHSARAARLRQDSAIVAYDVKTYERLAAGLKVTAAGRDRPLFVHEDAARVRWRRNRGAVVDVTGLRWVNPGDEDDGFEDGVLSPVPYEPGREELLIFGGDVLQEEVNERELVHPIATGAEAYYVYEVGDSTAMRLPGGVVVSLRELRVRPREPRWNVVVGSLWFAVGSGQLVRAAFRLAVPMDIWEVAEADDPDAREDVPKVLDPLLTPATASLEAIGIEYGLHEGRFWLPRARIAEGNGRMGFARVSFRFEQRFTYSSVNLVPPDDSLPEIPPPRVRVDTDTMSAERRRAYEDSIALARRARRDSVAEGLKAKPGTCLPGEQQRSHVTGRERDRVLVRIPCDYDALARSPDLPPSLFENDAETAYTFSELRALVEQSLPLGAQAGFNPQPIRLQYGAELLRYNRIEGLSAGLIATQELGAGYALRGAARLGVADLEPNVELGASRSNLSRTVRLTAYNRLVAANDWGNPLGFGSSVGALLFGRDEGFYYRASGADVRGVLQRSFAGLNGEWRGFLEQQRGARQRSDVSLFGDLGPNIGAARGMFGGAEMRLRGAHGLNPRGFRLFSDVRLEVAASDTVTYGRAALEMSVSRPLGRFALGLTAAAGSSTGEVPAQRLWYLGGTHTVRGQVAGDGVGDAFWLGRAELGTSYVYARPVIFADIGWAGRRSAFTSPGRPMSGAGVGASFMDGLLRFDVAQGLHPRRKLRVDLYLEGRF